MSVANAVDWWNAMLEKNAKTRATIANIIYDWRNKRVEYPLIRHLLATIGMNWTPDVQPSEPPERALGRVIDSDPARYLCKGRSLYVAGVPCSRVMTAQDLLEFNLDPSILMMGIKGYFTQSEIKDLERIGPGRAARGKMRTRRPLAWITRAGDLEYGRVSADEPANYARDALGLQYLQEDDFLVEVQYPERVLDDILVAVPTFIEGCPSLIYRSMDTDDGWGRAVNLQGLEDGLPEAVHPEVEFTSAFRIRNIGALRPPSPSLNWELFLLHMPQTWNCVTLDELEEM